MNKPKRLPTLPKKIRKAYRTNGHATGFGYVTPTPETHCSAHDVHRQTPDEVAVLDVDAVRIYRGRAKARVKARGGSTSVFVFGVLGDTIIWRASERIRWKDLKDKADRALAIAAMEHALAQQLRDQLMKARQDAEKKVEAQKHAALPSTRLTKVRTEIDHVVAKLAKLRVREAEILEEIEG